MGRRLVSVRGIVVGLGTDLGFRFFVSGRVQDIGDGGGRSRRSGFSGGESYGG